jgi:hypothetical protein
MPRMFVGNTHTNGRKERPLVPFSNFRFFKGAAKIREQYSGHSL